MFYPLIIQSCKENVVNADYLDISFDVGFTVAPKVTASTDTNVSVFVSNITSSGCRLNFSCEYTGFVYISAMATA